MKHKPSYWTYTISPKYDYPDPRIMIARQIGWQKYAGEDTAFSVPEPDNYNRAVLCDRPVDCTFVEDQVIYKVKDGWISVALVAEELQGEYTAWMERLLPEAYWQHTKPAKLKKTRAMPL